MLQNAIRFIADASGDKDLRMLCYESIKQGKLYENLAMKGYAFTLPEFEDAEVQYLFQCKDEDEADHIKQFGLWFKQLSRME